MLPARLSKIAVALLIALAACEADFNPTAPGGSTPYVICVLNPKDSAQYVRIQRSYICRDDAYIYSKNPDSIYYRPDEIEVYLTRFDTLDGSMMEDPIRLLPSEEIQKEEGLFSSSGHYLFKTTKFIYPEFEYELRIVFPGNSKTITSRIKPLGSWNLEHAFNREQRKLKYSLYHPERINYFMDLTPNRHPQLTRFLYTEMSASDTLDKYIEYFYRYENISNLDDNFDEQEFLGKDFMYRFIQREIPTIKGVRRIARGLDFMIQIADSNLLMYQKVETREANFLYSPEFNNLSSGGVGLFASRYKYTVFGKALKSAEIDSLSMGQYTRNLNFADSRGEFHDGR